MLYLTNPGAPGTFQSWRPPKSLISPSSGELFALQYRTLSGLVRCRCSFHKLIIAVYHWFRYNTRKQSHFFFFFFLIPRASGFGLPRWQKTRVEMCGNASVSRRWTRPRHSLRLSFSCTVNWLRRGDSGDRWQPEAGLQLFYLEREKKTRITPSYTPPVVSFCRVSAVSRGELRTVRDGEKGGCCVLLGWIQASVLHAVCCCNLSVIPASRCFRRKSHIFVWQKCAKDHQPQDKKSAKRRVWWKAAVIFLWVFSVDMMSWK